MISDRLFLAGAYEAAKLHSKLAPAYFYFFRFEVETSIADELSHQSKSLGVSHGDDIFLIYYNPTSRIALPYNEDEKAVGRQLIDLYQAFAANDDATYGGLEVEQVKPETVNCLEIWSPTNFSMTIKNETFGNSAFWKKLNIRDESVYI